MLENLEGKKGLPRLKPRFPAGSASMVRDHHQQRRIDRSCAGNPPPERPGSRLGKPNNTGTKVPNLRPRE